MSWAQRLKRVFGVEINTCARCGGKLKVIASIEEPEVIRYKKNPTAALKLLLTFRDVVR